MTVLTLLILTALQVAPAPPDPRLYTVGPNDVLLITVYNQPQLSGKFAVEADGTLAFPLLGRVAAGGLSVRAIEDKVREGLAAGLSQRPAGQRHSRPVPQPADLRDGRSEAAR